MSLWDRLKGFVGIGKPAGEAPAEAAPETPAEAAPATPLGPTIWNADQAEHDEDTPEPRRARSRASAEEDGRLEAEARALFDRGDAAAAVSFLKEETTLLAAHDPANSLPCLCRRCLAPELDRAESRGLVFVRDFVVTRHHTLFYWVLDELVADAKPMPASMRAEVRQRLRVRARKQDEPREGVNPFTKQKVTIVPKHIQRRINPFTGRPVR